MTNSLPDNMQEFMGWDWALIEPHYQALLDVPIPTENLAGWHRKQHIHRYPFYYIEYGVAQLGAVQVWRNALEDQAEAIAAYRRALALGGTADLQALYAAAGAKFSFDPGTLGEAVDLVEAARDELETKAQP